jgi:hypothetical protein
MTYDVRALSEAELDAVAGGNPGFVAGVAVGALLTVAVIGVAAGVKAYNDYKESKAADEAAAESEGSQNNSGGNDTGGGDSGGDTGDTGGGR